MQFSCTFCHCPSTLTVSLTVKYPFFYAFPLRTEVWIFLPKNGVFGLKTPVFGPNFQQKRKCNFLISFTSPTFTFHNFPGVFAASVTAANDDDPVSWHHHSCMAPSVLAEKRIDMKWLDLTLALRILSILLAHCAKRCKTSWCWPHRTPQSACHCRRQRGNGFLSLRRKI